MRGATGHTQENPVAPPPTITAQVREGLVCAVAQLFFARDTGKVVALFGAPMLCKGRHSINRINPKTNTPMLAKPASSRPLRRAAAVQRAPQPPQTVGAQERKHSRDHATAIHQTAFIPHRAQSFIAFVPHRRADAVAPRGAGGCENPREARGGAGAHGGQAALLSRRGHLARD